MIEKVLENFKQEDFKKLDEYWGKPILECRDKYIQETKANNQFSFMFLSALGYYVKELQEGLNKSFYDEYMKYFISNNPGIDEYISVGLEELRRRDEFVANDEETDEMHSIHDAGNIDT